MKTEDRHVCKVPFKMSLVGGVLSPDNKLFGNSLLSYRMLTINGHVFT